MNELAPGRNTNAGAFALIFFDDATDSTTGVLAVATTTGTESTGLGLLREGLKGGISAIRVEEAAEIRGLLTGAALAAATFASSFFTESFPSISARSAGIGPLSCASRNQSQ